MQLSAPLVQFPAEELPSIQASETSSIGFSSGSGHDLEGDSISVDGKNWTVRGESIWIIGRRRFVPCLMQMLLLTCM